MSNFQPISYESATGDLKAIYDEIRASTGKDELPNWLTYMGELPHVVKGTWGLLKSILADSQLNPILQDLILFVVAYHRTVPYCMALHASNLIRMTDNLSYSDLEEIALGHSNGYLPDNYQVASQVAIKLSNSNCNLSNEDFNRLQASGFNRVQSLEITMLVSVGMFLNTYTFAAGMPVDAQIQYEIERDRKFKINRQRVV